MAFQEQLNAPGNGTRQSIANKQDATKLQESDSKFFANEGVNALSHAFDRKIAIHPGVNGNIIPAAQMPDHFDVLLDKPRTGKSVAYIHVPFCRTHCLYCGFFTKAWSNDESARYVDMLIAEMNIWRGRQAMESGPVHAVYLGGGTPTELAAEDIRRLLHAAHEMLPLSNDCEITVEGRLSNFDERKMEACLEGGANRFSLGVQTFHSDIRRSMGRLGSREEMLKGLERLMSYDEAAIIVDLIYGFPNQSMRHWEEDLEVTKSLNLDGVDCYQLNVYKATPLGQAIENGKLPPAADIPQQAAMFAASVDNLTRAFYRRLSMSHWGRTARERNIYNIYVKGSANCLAFGPGAGGNLAGHFYANASLYEEWMNLVGSGQKPYSFMLSPSPHYYLFREIAERIEQGGLDLTSLRAHYGIDMEKACSPLLAQWERAGLIELDAGRLTLTLAGQFWHVNLSQLLQEYLKKQMEVSEYVEN